MTRLQLENGVLQEKCINEKRKVSILEVNLFHSFRCRLRQKSFNIESRNSNARIDR